jgi:8-oxo-dGTP pyrophosphatase MutT (NUDIX family)
MRGAVVVLLDDADRVLLLRRTPGDYWAAGLWGFPGGKLEPGETPEQAAIRETKEESNLKVWDLKELKLDASDSLARYYTRSYSGDVKLDFEHTDFMWADRPLLETYELAPGTLEMYDWVLNNE